MKTSAVTSCSDTWAVTMATYTHVVSFRPASWYFLVVPTCSWKYGQLRLDNVQPQWPAIRKVLFNQHLPLLCTLIMIYIYIYIYIYICVCDIVIIIIIPRTIFIVLSCTAWAICKSSLWVLWVKVGQCQVAANSYRPGCKLDFWVRLYAAIDTAVSVQPCSKLRIVTKAPVWVSCIKLWDQKWWRLTWRVWCGSWKWRRCGCCWWRNVDGRV